MISIKIPKDINEYEAKVIGPLTMRQLIVVGIAAPFMYLSYSYAVPLLGKDIGGFVLMIPAAVAALFGWVQPYGMRFEEFLRTAFISNVLSPQKRLYKTENFYEGIHNEILKQEKADEEKARKEKKEKQKKYTRLKRAVR